MNRVSLYIFCISCIFSRGYGQDPSTVITSDRMELIRSAELNEFKFFGNVRVNSVSFSGECDEMTVYSTPISNRETSDVVAEKDKNIMNGGTTTIGQIKEIIAIGDVHLKTEEAGEDGEKKESKSGRAHIYPNENKMILTENPIVTCSKQGTFSGDKITFFKDSGKVIVENNDPNKRAQAVVTSGGIF